MSTTTVLITGASGFIALHTIDELLLKGYNVIGTVRSQPKADKITQQFKELYPEGKLSFELVEDIGAEGAFNHVFQKHPEITKVLHTASPFSFGLNKSLEEGYLYPATRGTKNALQAVKDFAPQVDDVVVTSSFAAIVNPDKFGDKSFVHTEETWMPLEWEHVSDENAAYYLSKKLAEKLAREFVATEKPNFKLTTITPPYVFGPQKFEDALSNPTLNTSAEMVNGLLNVKPEDQEIPGASSGLCVDVRDVAKLHVLPLGDDKIAGLRLFPCNGAFNSQYLLNLIHEQAPEVEGKVGQVSPEGAKEQAQEANFFYDISKTEKATGLTWIPLEQTVKDAVSQIIEYRKANKIAPFN